MTEVLERKRLRLVSHCHLSPIHIRMPHVSPDTEVFPASSGFEDYSVAPLVGWFGGKFQLVDVSGLTRSEVKERVRADFESDTQVEAIRFLQCLEWIHEGVYHDKFAFERIVVYPMIGEQAVAMPTDAGFERALYQGDETPWPPGTLCLLHIPEI